MALSVSPQSKYRFPYQWTIGGLAALIAIQILVLATDPGKPDETRSIQQPAAGDTTAPKTRSSPSQRQLVNLNTASFEKLTSVRGIGEATAKRIIARRVVKPFESIEEVMSLERVSRSNFEMMKDQITVGSPADRSDR